MRFGTKRITNRLFQLIILLLPTQLAYHFWPDFSLVNGIRVDYLSPAVYLTDLLILVLIVISLSQKDIRKYFKNSILKYITIFLILVIFIFTNITFAYSPILAFIKWLKIIFFAIFATVVVINKDLNIKKLFPFPFFLSVILIIGIQIAQFINGSSIGGVFYFLGERTFDTNTIGIALVNILGQNFLRPYSLFPHPNALGGYLLVGSLILINSKIYIEKKFLYTTLLFSFVGMILSFSQTVWIAVVFIFLVYLLKIRKFKIIYLAIILISLVQLVLPYYSLNLITSESLLQRIALLNITGNILADNFVFGVGANNFISLIPHYSTLGSLWLLQPVHNIFVLVLVETGIVGIVVFYKMYTKITQFVELSKVDYFLKLALLGVFITGFADHYWLTLQQNTLLMAVLILYILISARKNYE